jgi:hypothetical protein
MSLRCLMRRSMNNAYGPAAVTSRLVLGEVFFGLQQPVNHQQLAHQVVQGLACGLPVRIADCLDQQGVGLLMTLTCQRPMAPLPPNERYEPSAVTLAAGCILGRSNVETSW